MANFKYKCIRVLLSCCFLLLSSFYVEGVEEDISLSKDEELQIDNQLKLLNKPAFKTIKTAYGGLYDCVDFYKQPAFDHPLLKNHTYHPRMRPSGQPSVSKRIRGNTRSKDEQIKFVRIGCPFGTVPIRRVTKEELRRTKLQEKRHALTYGVLTPQEPGVHYAITQTKYDPNKKYGGGSAWITIYNVTVKDPSQYSLARMRIHSGSDSIEVGTMTNPAIYNTMDTHLFVRTKTSKVDCFNLRCSYFVQTIKDIPIDELMYPVSDRGFKSINMKFSLVRDDDGKWWFYLGDDKTQLKMGFWPPVFTGGLGDLATGLDWGGEVSGPERIPSPPMGSGACPKEDALLDGYCVLMKTINEGKQETDAVDTETFGDSKFYKVIDKGVVSSYDGHLMFFGGPGDGGLKCDDSID